MRRLRRVHRLFAQAVRRACLAGCHSESCGLARAAATKTRGVVTSVWGQKRRFWMSANRSALPPKTDVTLALSDLRQRRANLAVNLRKVVRRQMRQPYRAARAAHTFTQAARPQRAPRPQTHQRRFYPPRPDAPRSFHRCRSKVRLGQRQVPEARYPCALSAAAMSLHHGLALSAVRLTEHG